VSLGPAEILVLVFVVLAFIGPRRLPGTARHLGPGWRDLRRDLVGLTVTDSGTDGTSEGSA
jgi:Sec-independent protein translocase protein TatA